MRVLDLSLNPEELASLRDSLVNATEDSLIFCRLQGRTVHIGRRGAMPARVHSDYCIAHNIPVFRLASTGYANSSGYHDQDEFRIAMVITNKGDIILSSAEGIQRLQQTMKTALAHLEVDALLEGNNISVGSQKIGALTAYAFGDTILFNLKVLMGWDIDTAEKAIISPVHNMRTHISSLSQLGKDVTFGQLKDAFINALPEEFNLEQVAGLTENEIARVAKAREMYASETWLKYGKWSPVKDYWRPE